MTVGGARFDLDRPFFVLATQNPIEQEGTYPLPEAQLDRFMFNVVIDYPTADEERRILAQTTPGTEPVIAGRRDGRRDRADALGIVRDVPGGRKRRRLRGAAGARHPPGEGPGRDAGLRREWVRWGAGPRAGQALLLGAKARALLDGRSVVAPRTFAPSRRRCCAIACS